MNVIDGWPQNTWTCLLAGPVGLPGEVAEEVRGGLAQPVGGGGVAELAHHGGDEAGGGAEEGLDVLVAEGEVGEGDHGVAPHLRAGGAAANDRGRRRRRRGRRRRDAVAVDIALDLGGGGVHALWSKWDSLSGTKSNFLRAIIVFVCLTEDSKWDNIKT